MRGHDFAELQAFVTIAREGGVTRAARVLGVSASSLSQTLRALEARLGVRLLNRTTRSLSLTDAGRALLERVEPGLGLLEEAVAEASAASERPAGRLRLNAPRVAVILHLEPIFARFAAAYPDVELDITVTDKAMDIAAGGYDAGIRLGELLEADMVAVPLGGELRQVAAASPSYLARHGTPRLPEDLLAHRCINWRKLGAERPYAWEFLKDGAWVSVAVKGPLTLTDRSLCIPPALDGLGIVFATEERIRPHLESGALVEVLREFSGRFPGFFLYHFSRRHPPPALRALLRFLREERRAAL